MEYNAISLFTGAMGLDLGLEKCGILTRVCVEKDKHCCETIRVNKPGLPVLEKGIEDVSSEEILEAAGMKRKDVFLIVGGPPCQAFSTAGSRKSLQDIRGNCILEFVKKVTEIKPQYFIMENVRGLLSAAIDPDGDKPKNRENEAGSVLTYILTLFKEAGYTVSFALLDAANYGVPQMRERVVFFGNKGEKRIPLPAPTHTKDGKIKQVALKKIISNMKGVEHHYVDFPEKRKRYLKLLKAGENWRNLPEEMKKEAMGASYLLGGGKTGFYRRLSWDKPSPTLVTRPNMPATDLCHPEELRPLSIEEYKRIQQFPDNWKLSGKLLDQYKQIGNAVPVGLGCVLGMTILNFHTGKVTEEEKLGVKYSRYNGTTDKDLELKQLTLSYSS